MGDHGQDSLDFGSADMACADDTGAANVDHTTAGFESNQSYFLAPDEDGQAEMLDFADASDEDGQAEMLDFADAEMLDFADDTGFMGDHGQDSSLDSNFAAFHFDFAGTNDTDACVCNGNGIGVFSPSSRSKALTRTSSTIDGHNADGDAGYAADGDGDDEQPAWAEHPLKKQRQTTRRNMPMQWRPLYREILTSYCVNNAPRVTCCEDEGGTALLCEHDGCSNAAAVWCRTCEHTLCRECDVVAHSGQICNPVPHMRETVFTGVELGPKEAAPTEDGLADVIPNVYLVCSAVCQGCGLRNWTPAEATAKLG